MRISVSRTTVRTSQLLYIAPHYELAYNCNMNMRITVRRTIIRTYELLYLMQQHERSSHYFFYY
jgi:hypothetical protein